MDFHYRLPSGEMVVGDEIRERNLDAELEAMQKIYGAEYKNLKLIHQNTIPQRVVLVGQRC